MQIVIFVDLTYSLGKIKKILRNLSSKKRNNHKVQKCSERNEVTIKAQITVTTTKDEKWSQRTELTARERNDVKQHEWFQRNSL